MTALAKLMAAQIASSGAISLADFMAEALMHPEHGYYSTRDPFGTAGDFTTAPEISQMFGELIGLSLAQAWIDQSQPAAFALVELGPGRGTLMADILRASAKVTGFHAAAQVHLVETSATLRAEQAKRLAAMWPSSDRVHWHDSITTLPKLPIFLVANEFFDALPIRQFQRDGTGWREVLVTKKSADLAPDLSTRTDVRELAHRLEDTKDGDIVEFCPTLPKIVSGLSAKIATQGGVAIIVDYGDWRSLGDTLQAVQNHTHVNPFATPGDADITAHVDFEAIAHACAPAKFTRLTPQGVFLERLGITGRAQTLAGPLSGDALESHIAAHRRLTDPAEMGSLFKVMGIYPKDAPPPAGLEP